MKKTITIATRESPLALWQANFIKEQLEKYYPNILIKILGVTTTADKMLDISLIKIGGKGLFVKELEEALLTQKADIAVHSMKDVPMELPDELCIPVVCDREDPRDAFVSDKWQDLNALPLNVIIGTSSLRRQCQILHLRPDLKISPLRGNVNTRLKKLDKNEFGALILATAGLKRLGLENRIRSYLSIENCLPAAGQGVLGIECRKNDIEVLEIISVLNNKATELCISAERAMCKKIGGGCQAPVAAFAEIKGNQLFLKGLVGSPDGSIILRSAKNCGLQSPKKLGEEVANDLLKQGAEEILACLKNN